MVTTDRGVFRAMVVQKVIVWLREHLTITQYISLHLLAGLAISILCLRILAELVEAVFTHKTFPRIDVAVADQLHAAATPGATQFFLVVSAFGFQVLWLIAVLVGLYFIWRHERAHLGLWIVALLGGLVINLLLKAWFARPRPTFANPLTVALFYSFPSGHATLSLVVYGLLTYFLRQATPHVWERILLTSGAILLVLLIGFSRLYLGVHYLSDVLAGFATGGLWLSFCITGAGFLYDWRMRRHPPT